MKPLLNNTTALLGSEQYGLFTFGSLALDQLVPRFFLQGILVSKEQLKPLPCLPSPSTPDKKKKKKKGLVPQMSLLKPTCAKMLALDPITKNTKMISKFYLPSTLARPQIKISSPLSNHTQPLEKTELRVITKRKSGTLVVAEKQCDEYEKSTSFPIMGLKSCLATQDPLLLPQRMREKQYRRR